MISKVLRIECDWCGKDEEMDMDLHKGVGVKRFENQRENDGWIKVITPKGVNHFCEQKCRSAWNHYEIQVKHNSKDV